MDGASLLGLSEERQMQVDAVLARFFTLSKNRAAAFGPQYVQLWETLEQNTVGGKRFRPKMVLCAYQALGGTDLEAAASRSVPPSDWYAHITMRGRKRFPPMVFCSRVSQS